MHKQFLRKALEQAYRGRGMCAPNPSVGAVLVHNQHIIAMGHHQGVGTAHAEKLVLSQTPLPFDSTLYVTLEPCNHWGRTPPCVSAIIQSGIRRVVYAFPDPNPLVRERNTPELLTAAGIEVIHYPLEEIDAFYQSYGHWMKTKNTWLTAKIAQTFDGKIAGKDGARLQLSNDDCAQFTHEQRRHTDLILTSAETLCNDNPLLTARTKEGTWQKPIAIIDRQLRVEADAKALKEAKHCYVFHDSLLTVKNPLPNCTYIRVPLVNQQLDLAFILQQIGQLGFHDTWLEAGGRLFSAFHEQGLVHRTYLYLVPMILGDEAVAAYQGKNFFKKPYRILWQSKGNNVIACLEWLNDWQDRKSVV